MSIRFEIRPDKGDLRKIERAIERLAKVGRRPRRPLLRIGLYVRREARQSLRSRKRDWGPSSGRLGSSLTTEAGDNYVLVGSNLVYAAIQHYGGVVLPKHGKYLALPATAALRRRGVWPRDLPRGSMKYVRVTDITIGSRSWRGPALVRAASTAEETSLTGAQGRDAKGKYAKKGEGGTLKLKEVMFALVKKVTIKARPYLHFGASAQRFALAEFEREYRRAFGGE